MPKDFPPWQTVYRYFTSFSKLGIWGKILDALHVLDRLNHDLSKDPSFIIIDSQSTKAHYGEERGYDGFKKVRGRKRHILVDSEGLPFAILVTPANKNDAKCAIPLLQKANLHMSYKRCEAILLDGTYKNRELFEYSVENYGIMPSIKASEIKYKEKRKLARELVHSSLKPKRWIVERTFAWFNHYRRLSRDYERKIVHSEAVIQLAIVSILLHRLAPA